MASSINRPEPARGSSSRDDQGPAEQQPSRSYTGRLALAWAVVGIPLAYGVSQTVIRAGQLFG